MKRVTTRVTRSREAKAQTIKRHSLECIQKQIILDYINVEGHGVWLDSKGQQRLADRVGMSLMQLTRLLNELAQRGDIQLSALNCTPIALPYWYRRSAA